MEILDAKNEIDENKLEKIAHSIRNGKICLFPTETVYGIGTNGLDENAVEKLYKMKNRNRSNPTNLLVNNMSMIEKITINISSLEYKLMEAFFPGPLTIILKRKKIIPNIVTANSDLVGIRIPNNIIARKLIDFANVPLATPSANISGKLSGTKITDIINEFSENLDFAIDGGESKIGLESTIVRVIDNIPHILRPGSITPEQIKSVAENVILENNNNSLLPSSNIRHYQLDDINSILIYDKNPLKMVDTIIDLSNHYNNSIILCCTENAKFYSSKNVISIASKFNLEDYSKNLFSCLHKASSLHPNTLLIEGIEKKDLGIAIMNRLECICNNCYIND